MHVCNVCLPNTHRTSLLWDRDLAKERKKKPGLRVSSLPRLSWIAFSFSAFMLLAFWFTQQRREKRCAPCAYDRMDIKTFARVRWLARGARKWMWICLLLYTGYPVFKAMGVTEWSPPDSRGGGGGKIYLLTQIRRRHRVCLDKIRKT